MRAFHGDNWWEFLRSFSLYVAPMLLGSYQFYWGDGLLQFWRKLILGKTTFSFVYYRKACFKVTCTILAPPRVLRYFRTFVILHVLWIEIDLWQLKISNYLVFSNLFFCNFILYLLVNFSAILIIYIYHSVRNSRACVRSWDPLLQNLYFGVKITLDSSYDSTDNNHLH